MFRACTASSAAFIATSYMPHMPKMATNAAAAETLGTQSPKVNTTSGPQKATEDKDETAVKEIVRSRDF